MGSVFADSLLFPAMILGFLAWLVPKLLAMVLDEGVKPLMLNAFLSALFLFALSSGFFFCLYLWRDAPLEQLWSYGWAGNLVFFGRLGLSSALIWAPIMILSVAGLPRHWTRVSGSGRYSAMFLRKIISMRSFSPPPRYRHAR